MKRYFVDTTVLTFALGGDHALREPCRSILDGAAEKTIEIHASVEAIQELLFHRLRRDSPAKAAAEARHLRAMLRVHAFDEEVLEDSINLVDSTTIRGRDAVHAATALAAGFTQIVSADTDFDGIPGLTRVDPTDVRLD